MAVEVILPRVDMDMTTGKITKWFANEGDAVTKGQALFEIESDKAAMEVESPAAGVLRGVTGRPGDELPVATVVGWIVAPGEAFEQKSPAGASAAAAPAAPAKAASDSPAVEADKAAPTTAEAQGDLRATPKARRLGRELGVALLEVQGRGPGGRIQGADVEAAAAKRGAAAAAHAPASALANAQAGPAARRLAAELGVEIAGVKGTGEKGLVTKDDVKTAFRGGGVTLPATAIPDVPTVDFEKFGPVEVTPLSRIKRISGPRLHASWLNIPHVTHCDEADITELEAFRRTLDEAGKADKDAYRVSLLPLVIKASVAALKAFPLFNSALVPTKDALVTRNYWNIGVAIDTPDGLVVAVVREADRKGVTDIARELGALSAKAREGKLTPAEMQGATFTISSLGGIGGTAFTPIVNAPEVAILGVVRASMAPVWDGAAFQPRLMLPLCLSYDHRVIDGAAAARFTRRLADLLTDIRRVLL